MCGGFTCSKNTLVALNVLYVLVSFILIGVAAYGIAASFVTSLAIIGGVIACGVFLFLLSLLGLIGAIKHNQMALFFYMIILFLLFIVQFGIACACLAFNEEQQHDLAYRGWEKAPKNLRGETQVYFNCCEYENETLADNDPMKGPSCQEIPCCQNDSKNCSKCPACEEKLQIAIKDALKITGVFGLLFSFTEVFSVCLTYEYRRQRDPKLNPSLLFS